MDPEVRARSEIIANLGERNALYVEIWDEIKAANRAFQSVLITPSLCPMLPGNARRKEADKICAP
jgi:hypothetical protein